jgi:hypothetical protein
VKASVGIEAIVAFRSRERTFRECTFRGKPVIFWPDCETSAVVRVRPCFTPWPHHLGR